MFKISKTQAYKSLVEGKFVTMAASKVRPECGLVIDINDAPSRDCFEKLCNAFRYYNCGSETGNGISFMQMNYSKFWADFMSGPFLHENGPHFIFIT